MTHPEVNIRAIQGSLHVYGQRKPIVVNRRNKVVETDNSTRQAALSLGWTHLAAVRVAFYGATAAGFAIADNRTAELSEWDKQPLHQRLREVSTGNDPRLDEMLADLAKKTGVVPGEDTGGENKDAAGDAGNRVAMKWQIVIDCKGEIEQVVLLERLRAEGYSCQGKSV